MSKVRIVHALAIVVAGIALAGWAQNAATPPASSAARAASAAPAASAASSPAILRLLVNPEVLPAGRAGAPYKPVRLVMGGVPGYTIRIGDGQLPEGMALSADGTLAGTPKAAGTARFTVRASDSGHPPETAQQTYTLRIAAAGAARPASAASAPQPVTAVTLGPDPPSSNAPAVISYQLLAADLDEVFADPAASGGEAMAGGEASPPALDAAQGQLQGESDPVLAKQQREMLLPMLNQEFPTRAMFERALELRACNLARAVVMAAEKKSGLPPKAEAITCPPWPAALAKPASAAKPAASASKAASAPGAAASSPAAPIPIAQLPAYLLPDDRRAQLVDKAAKPHRMASAPAAEWDGSACGCVYEDLAGEVYGFYPFWAATAKPQPVNLALLSAIGYHAATFGDDGGLATPASWEGASRDIAVTARRHNTRLDLVVWRSDWSSLPRDDAGIERAAGELARNAVQAIDKPLADPDGKWTRFVPFYRPQRTTADGIALFFDDYPVAGAGADAFVKFANKAVLALVAQLRRNPSHDVTVSLVIPQQRIGRPPFEYGTLFEQVKQAEEPHIVQERIVQDGENYRSNTNVTLKFLVLLPEATTKTKKELRQAVEQASGIYGNDRRVLLRKIVPVLAYAGGDPAQFADDLAYFRDNFGGVGFWPTPLTGIGVAADMERAVAHAFRQHPERETSAICRIACTNRWLARAAFYLFVGTELLALVWVAAIGGFRCLGKTSWAGLLLVAIGAFFFGGALLNCDPDLRALREGNSLLWTGIVVFIVASVYATFVPRDPKP